jgi:hypothetical protein
LINVKITNFDEASFLGANASFPSECHNVTKLTTGGLRDDRGKFFTSNEFFVDFSSGWLKTMQRIDINVALLIAPDKNPFDGTNEIAF